MATHTHAHTAVTSEGFRSTLRLGLCDHDEESVNQAKGGGSVKGRAKEKSKRGRKEKERTRCQLRILIAAKQPSAKLQSAKSTEDENSEGKTERFGATQNANAQVFHFGLFSLTLTPWREPLLPSC